MNKILVKLLKPKQSIKCKSTNLYLWDPEVADTLITTMQAIRDEILKLVDNESVDTLLNIADDVVKVANISGEITTLSGYVAEITQLTNVSDSIDILAKNIESILTDANNIESIKINAENIDAIIGAKDNADRAEENATKAENAVALVEAQVKEVITEYLPQIEEKGNIELEKITTEGNSQYNKIQTEGDTQYNRINTQGNIELEKIKEEGLDNKLNIDISNITDAGKTNIVNLLAVSSNSTAVNFPYIVQRAGMITCYVYTRNNIPTDITVNNVQRFYGNIAGVRDGVFSIYVFPGDVITGQGVNGRYFSPLKIYE